MNETNFELRIIREPMERDTYAGKGYLIPCRANGKKYQKIEGHEQYEEYAADLEVDLSALDGVKPEIGDILTFKGSGIPRSRRSDKGMTFSSLYCRAAGKVSFAKTGGKGVTTHTTDSVKV